MSLQARDVGIHPIADRRGQDSRIKLDGVDLRLSRFANVVLRLRVLNPMPNDQAAQRVAVNIFEGDFSAERTSIFYCLELKRINDAKFCMVLFVVRLFLQNRFLVERSCGDCDQSTGQNHF